MKIRNFCNDCSTMTWRCCKHLTRNFDALTMSLVVPTVILIVFNYLFGGAINTGYETSYINYVVPGIIILCVGYSASTTSLSINSDMKNGVVDRFRSMPISRASFLVGQIVAALIRNVITTIILILTALILGFRPVASPLDWLVITAVLLTFAFMITAYSTLFGMLAKTPDGASIFGFVMMFLPYFSSAFVPIETMPKPIRGFSTHQPISVVLETIKGMTLGTGGGNVPLSLLWCSLLGALGVILSTCIFVKKGR